MLRRLLVVCAGIALVSAGPQLSETDNILHSALKIVKECGDKSVVLCMKERALHYMDDQDFGDVKLTEGIELVKSSDDIPLGRSLSSSSLPDDPENRESEIDSMLVERVARFFGTHTLQFKVPRDSIEDMQRSLEEGAEYPLRNVNIKPTFSFQPTVYNKLSPEVSFMLIPGVFKVHSKSKVLALMVPRSRELQDVSIPRRHHKGHHKKKKYLLPLLLLFKLKAAALLPMLIGFLALVAFKALVIGKIALVLSGIIGLKKLFESKNTHQSYEVVAHPHYSSSSFDDHNYGRSIDDESVAHKLAYAAHTK